MQAREYTQCVQSTMCTEYTIEHPAVQRTVQCGNYSYSQGDYPSCASTVISPSGSRQPTLYKCSAVQCSTVQCSTVHYTLYNKYNKYSAEQCSAVQPLCNCTSHLWQPTVLCGLWSGVCVHNYTAWSNIIDWTGYLPLPVKHCHSQRTVRKQLAVQYKTQQPAV